MGGNFLQFTVFVGGAMSAVDRMGSHEQLKTGTYQPQNPGTSGINNHAVSDRFGTGGYRVTVTFNLDKAESAGSRWFWSVFNGTEIGDVDAVLQRHPEEVFSRGGCYPATVDG